MANHLAAGAIPMTQRTTQDWHQRYLQQASWTGPSAVPVCPGWDGKSCPSLKLVAVQVPFYQTFWTPIPPEYTLDISAVNLRLAAETSGGCHLTHGDALNLPFESGTFDLVLYLFSSLGELSG